MASVAVRVSQKDNMVQIQFDIIYLNFSQYKEYKGSLKRYLESDARAYNIHGTYVSAEQKEFIMCDNKETNIVDECIGEFVTLNVPNNPAIICELLLVLEEYFALYHSNPIYHVGLGADAITDRFVDVNMLNTSLSAFVHEWTKSYPSIHQLVKPYLAASAKNMPLLTKFTNDYVKDMQLHYFGEKADTKQLIIADYLAAEIAKLYPACQFLRAIKLLDPKLAKTERETLLSELKKLIEDKVVGKDDAKIVLNYLTKTMKSQLLSSCVGKKAANGLPFMANHSLLELLREAAFCLQADGRLCIDLTKNWVYAERFSSDQGSHDTFIKNLNKVQEYLGLAFAPESNFTTNIVFAKECSDYLIRKGVALRNEFFNEKEFENVEDLDEVTKDIAYETVTALPSTFFSQHKSSAATTTEPTEAAVASLRASQ